MRLSLDLLDTKEASNQPLLLKDIEHEGASGPAKSQALSLVNQQEKVRTASLLK